MPPSPRHPAPLPAAVEFTIECRMGADAPSGVTHPVTIHTDWTMTTPHDLDAERVGVALGGYSSCVLLNDVTLPAVRAALPLLSRAEPCRLRRSPHGWAVSSPARRPGCCRTGAYRSIHDAVRHIVSNEHLVHGTRAPLWQFDAVRSALGTVHGFAQALDACEANPLSYVDSVADLRTLWNAGIGPHRLPELAAPASVVGTALSVPYFLGAAYADFDHDWFRTVLPARPDIDTAVWLIGLDSPHTMGTAAQWRQWLQLGVRKDDVLFALTHGLDAVAVGTIADDLGLPRTSVADATVKFAAEGFALSAEHFALFATHGIDRPRPLRRAVDEIEAHLTDSGGRRRSRAPSARPPARTELAVMLVLLGTKSDVASAVACGARTAAGLPLDGTPQRHIAELVDVSTTPLTAPGGTP